MLLASSWGAPVLSTVGHFLKAQGIAQSLHIGALWLREASFPVYMNLHQDFRFPHYFGSLRGQRDNTRLLSVFVLLQSLSQVLHADLAAADA